MNRDCVTDRRQRIARLLEELASRALRGGTVSDDQVLAAHPELMPELADALRDLRRVLAARRRGVESAAPEERSSGRALGAASGRGAGVEHLPGFAGYTVTRELQRGGQGSVYEAIQQSTGRLVAIKLMHAAAMPDSNARARFQREVQILRQLRHPHLVTVLDSGSAAGRAFLVTELVAGRPVDEYVLASMPSVRECVRLMTRICAGVNAAHLAGVIHRDLKPSNVLVDENGDPFVLDFGLARLEAADGPTMTQTGQFVGSLPWASPEQVSGRAGVTDTRSDVYSLGVLFYQLLTGVFPYCVAGPIEQTIQEITQQAPVPPSRHRRHVDDELETIVLKCLQKEPQRRYDTAGQLENDLKRYLSNEPIEAKRDSRWYLLKKFAGRCRLALGSAALLVVLVCASSVVLWRSYREQLRLRVAAQDALRKVDEQRSRAEMEAGRRGAVQRFLATVLMSATPESHRGEDPSIQDALLAAADRIEAELEGQPLVEAAVREVIGRAFHRLGRYEEASAHLGRAVELFRAIDGGQEELPGALQSLAHVRWKQGRDAESAGLLRELLRALEGREDDASIDTRLGALNSLAVLRTEHGALAEAERVYREVLDIRRERLGSRHVETAGTLNNLGLLLLRKRQFDEAVALLEESLAIYQGQRGEDHPTTINLLNNLAGAYREQGDMARAEPLYREAIDVATRVRGADHPDTLTTINNLGLLLMRNGRFGDAQPLLERTYELRLAKLGEQHADALTSRVSIAVCKMKQGEFVAAQPELEAAVTIAERALPPGHPLIAMFRYNLAQCLLGLGRFERAESLFLSSLESHREMFGPNDPRTHRVMSGLAELYHAWGRPEAAARFDVSQR